MVEKDMDVVHLRVLSFGAQNRKSRSSVVTCLQVSRQGV